MTIEATTTAVETNSTTSKKSNKKGKKAVKKAASKKAVKKTSAKKTSKKAESNGQEPRARKEGLRDAQVRIMKAMKDGKERTRKEIADKSKSVYNTVGDYLGPRPEGQSEETAAKWPFPTLVELGYLKTTTRDYNGRDVIAYVITPKGKAAAAKL